MNIDLELYRIFYIVAKNGSISAASNILYISQSIELELNKIPKQLFKQNE